MPNHYLLSITAEEDLIRIYHYGLKVFGSVQADKYLDKLYHCFDTIAERPFSFESVEDIRKGYRRCVCGRESIYFKHNKETVIIMAIVGRQNIGRNLE